MSIYQIREEATVNKDMDSFAATMHDDFVTHESRCLYENDDVMVTHGVMSFPDGSREAVLAFHQIKDGKVIRMETGATLLE